jgi:hypothetical protein
VRIGLYNLEPKVENTAMMQVSTYHKQLGDEVEKYNPFETYDKVYCFSIFDYTKKWYIKPGFVCGGTGFDLTTKLPKEIEDCEYDYSLFPKCDTSYVWFSRGCIRACPFCVVNQKEGYIQSVTPKKLNPKGKYISIMDNNFFANPGWWGAIEQLKAWGQPVLFQSGLDVRLFDDEMGKALQSIKIYKQLHIAWDNPKEDLTEKIELLKRYVPKHKIMCYVLIGYWSTPEEDLMRSEKLRELKIDPFAMPFNRKDKYQKAFVRWVNHKAIWKSVKWVDYKKKRRKLT